MNNELMAFLLLNACETLDRRVLKVLDLQGITLSEIWNGGKEILENLPVTAHVKTKLMEFAGNGWAETELERCGRAGIKLVPITCKTYPSLLKEVPTAPLLLYIKGQWPPDGRCVSVVGTRRCSSYGIRVAHMLGEELASVGLTPISGGAKGIDGSVHSGALDADGATVAVLGTGVDIVYPGGHEHLFDKISAGAGALISEYPLGTRAAGWRFPKRNRIIAGMSEKLIVVEAPLRSGAMITAKYAMELGREVWSVPGRIGENVSRGSNGLIFDGAYPLIDVETFIGSFSEEQLNLFRNVQRPSKPESITDAQEKILSLLREKGERTVDNIASECKMSAAEVLNSIGLLVAVGNVYPSSPGRWSASLK